MSSHHIVREKQEPALLIMSLEGFSPEHLGQLLEWSPTILLNESIYELADSMGIKIDGVLTQDPNFNAQEHTLLILSGTEPLQDALKYLVAQGYPAVNVIDQTFSMKDYLLYVDLINLVIFTPFQKIFPVKSGFSKWQTGGEKIFVLHEVHQLQTEGLEQVDAHTWRTVKDGFYALEFDQPFIFIAEEL
ncbi:MAG: hypothetical protein RI924_219 [Bacteroidota bacterium]|jgi:thiamine pyrophosphokinase